MCLQRNLSRALCRRHALELGAARAEQTAAWLRTHTFMPPAERAEWSEFVSSPPCCLLPLQY